MAKQSVKAGDFSKFKVKDIVFRNDDAATGDFITHHARKCTGCGECVLVCAASLWSVPKGKDKAKLSSKYRQHCLECAACYAMCSQDAIEFRYPNGGAGVVIKHG